MQGVSIWGLFLALGQLLQCGVNFAADPEAQTDLIGSISVKHGLQALLDVSMKDVQSKTLEETIADVLNKSIVYEKPVTKKKETGFDVKKVWPDSANKTRTRRQVGAEIPIITLKPVVQGTDEPKLDNCERDEILHQDGECYEILDQGPCEDTEYVLMDMDTKKGFCAPRLCSPDRVFVFEDQECHDPFENDICPPGRYLSTSCFGTPVCLCPDGTYEEEDDPDEDVCKPILAEIDSCGFGEVFWFTNFRSEARCIPDPCSGINSKRSPNELPYIPSAFDGNCYQVGKEIPQCPSDTFYTISFSGLKGICASLEDAGYMVADEDVLSAFASRYGSPLQKDIGSFSFASASAPSRTSRREAGRSRASSVLRRQEKSAVDLEQEQQEEQEQEFEENTDNRIRQTTDFSKHAFTKSLLHFLIQAARDRNLQNSNSRTRPASRRGGVKKAQREEEEHEEQELEEEEEEPHRRRKRDSLPYASPSNVFEPSLAACRSGAIRGLNNKCRTSVLPSRRPLSRPKRRAPPTRPIPSCALGHFYTIGNRCVNNNGQIQASLLSQGLG